MFFIYCRVSSEEQANDNHYSLENQETRGRDYCKSRDWRVADIRKDVASGKDAHRDGFQDLRNAVESEKAQVVIVYRLDRLSRNVRDIYDSLDLIAKHNVGLVSLCESLDTTTAMGRAMLGVMAVFAQLTREMIAENVKDGMQYGTGIRSTRLRHSLNPTRYQHQWHREYSPVLQPHPCPVRGQPFLGLFRRKGNPVLRWLGKHYQPALSWIMDRRVLVVACCAGAMLASFALAPKLGSEFLSEMDEGSVMIRATLLPSVSLNQSLQMAQKMERILMTFSEATDVVSKIGRAEIGGEA